MPWLKVDDNLTSHPKVLRIPRRRRLAAMGLWALTGAYCARNLTDGQIESALIDTLDGDALAPELAAVGLWHISGHKCQQCPQPTDPEGYVFHDWTQANPSRADVEAKRAAARARMEKSRSSSVRANSERTVSEPAEMFARSSLNPVPVPEPEEVLPSKTFIHDADQATRCKAGTP